MNNMFSKILAVIVLFSGVGNAAWAQTRIATINIQKVFDKYWKTKEAANALKIRADGMEKEHKNMLNDWTKAKEDYQQLVAASNDQARSSDEREKSKKSATEKLKYLKETEDTILVYEKQAHTTLDEQKRQTIEKILVEIRTIVGAQAKESGNALVIDTSAEGANRTPIILYSTNEQDLTDAVIARLNSTAPAEAAKPETKSTEK